MKTNVHLILILALLTVFTKVEGQGECNLWYFGEQNGLDFSNESLEVINNGNMIAQSGCASISDKYGNLLFYTNGLTIWNAQHDTMPNGGALIGCTYLQDCMVVPHPGDNTRFFVFKHDCASTGVQFGLTYSVVDMTLDNGLGDVTSRDSMLGVYSMGRMHVVRHCNKRDYWLIVHSATDWVPYDEYYVYHISAKGVDPNPIVIPTPFETRIYNFILSPNDNVLYASTGLANNNGICRYQFNNATGQLQLTDTMFLLPNQGLQNQRQFTADGRFLYAVEATEFYRYDFSLGSDSLIYASRVELLPDSKPLWLTLGHNGALFVTREFEPDTMLVITNPSELDPQNLDCDTIVFSNTGAAPYYKPPSFISGFKYSNSFEWDMVCVGDTILFEFMLPDCDSTASVPSLLWDFGDPSSGSENASTLLNPGHSFAQSGDYKVSLTVTTATDTSTVFKTIRIMDNPLLDLGADMDSLQPGTSVSLDAGIGMSEYLWSSGATSQQIEVDQPGNYSVSVTDRYGCSSSDAININYIGIDEADNHDLIMMYPNPANNLVQVTSRLPIKEVKIIDINGRTLYIQQGDKSETLLDVSTLLPGRYIVEISLYQRTVTRNLLIMK